MENRDLAMARRIAEKVAQQGGHSYFVGGYVRDLVRGEPGKDIDMEVHGIAPEALERILDSLGSRNEIGKSFGIWGLRGYDLDIAMPRLEHKTGAGHRDFSVFVDPFCGPAKAAQRRDFTVNAMMQDVITGEILDPYGGREDLQKGILRHVCDDSFGEDPLRVLRGAQFAARFRFQIADSTMALCRTMDLSSLPRERILGEMEKALLKSEKPSIFFEVLREMGQLSCWFPELEALIGVPQSPRHHAEGDVWVHTMMVLDAAVQFLPQVRNPLGFLLAALTHDFGKAVCTEVIKGELHAYKHELLGIPLADAFLRRLTSEKQLRDYVLNLDLHHMKPNVLAGIDASIKSTNRMFDEAMDPEALIAIAMADGLGKLPQIDPQKNLPFLQDRLKTYREYMARPSVQGKDLIGAGLKPSGHFKEYLELGHKLHLAGVEKDNALRQVLALARKTEKS